MWCGVVWCGVVWCGVLFLKESVVVCVCVVWRGVMWSDVVGRTFQMLCMGKHDVCEDLLLKR